MVTMLGGVGCCVWIMEHRRVVQSPWRTGMQIFVSIFMPLSFTRRQAEGEFVRTDGRTL